MDHNILSIILGLVLGILTKLSSIDSKLEELIDQNKKNNIDETNND